jgi:Tfp pilus assembly protein PilF
VEDSEEEVAVLEEAVVEFSRLNRLKIFSIGMFSLAGCATLTPITNLVNSPEKKLTQENESLPDNSQTIMTRAPLQDPAGQQLAISRETARLAEERGLDSEAIQAYLDVRKLDPTAKGVAHALAVLYDRSGMTDAAAKEYQTALKESPQNADLRCDYGYFLYSTGRDAEAEESLKESLRLSPDHRQATINLALLVGHQGRYDEALTLFTKAIGPAAALHNVGLLKLQAGETIAAKQMLAEASRRDPSIRQSPKLREWLEAPGSDLDGGSEVVAGHEDSNRESSGRVSLAN